MGNGVFELNPDPRFGKVFHNDPTLTKAVRANWLELPSDIFSHSSQTKEMTIGFWVNKMSAADYFFCPLFTAYGNDNVNKSHQWTEGGENGWYPFFYLETRGLMQWNAEGWCDFTDEQNDAGTNAQTTAWTDDGKWHYVTMTFTTTKAVVYVDGEVVNSWTIADDGLAGLFTQTVLTHFCLGGNQAFGWDDADPAFAFDNFAVYDQALSAAQIKQVMAAAQADYSAPTTPLTMGATSDGTIKVNSPKTGMQYSLNGGTKTTMNGTTTINVKAGDKVYLFGNGTNITVYQGTRIAGGTATCTVYGNIMSLVDEENYATATALANYAFIGLFNLGTTLNTALTDASGLLLPATTLSQRCYEGMFSGCTNLTAAPELPATTMVYGCYSSMFHNCSSLTVAPTLPAATLANDCYTSMFLNCSSLSSVTCLATTNIGSGCYNWLANVAATGTFTAANKKVAWIVNSSSGIPTGWSRKSMPLVYTPLTVEATSDGTIKVNSPRAGMQYSLNGGAKTTMNGTTTINVTAGDMVQFYGNGTNITNYQGTQIAGGTAACIVYGNIMSLVDEENYATSTTLANEAFCELFFNNTMLTDASELVLPATTLAEGCYSSMFYGCTGLTTAPALPATTLAEECYYSMFAGCTGLTAAPELPATTLVKSCYGNMFKGCTGLTAAPELPATTLVKSCYASMFYGCTGLTTAPELPATTLAEGCYRYMFAGCTGLTTAPELPATTLVKSCYYSMFSGCTGLTAAPELPATTLAERCYYGMFAGCTGLTTTPELPATTLAVECYFAMFEGCEGLTAAPALPATKLAVSCYGNMFKGCTGLTAAPALPAATLVKGCYSYMFLGCAKLSSVTCLATDISATDCTYQWLEGVAETGVFTPADDTVAWERNSASGIPTGWNGGTPTGLNKVNANEEGTIIYDFMGRRVKNARRGMFIQNGKKVARKW